MLPCCNGKNLHTTLDHILFSRIYTKYLRSEKPCATSQQQGNTDRKNQTVDQHKECIKISAKNDGLTLVSTDGEIAIQKKINAEVFEEGEIAVPGKYFSDFIKKLENVQITLSTDGDKLTIQYADAESVIQLLNAEDFPSIDMEIGENQFTLLQKDLKELIARTTFCCAQDDSRPVLKGCLIEAKEGMVTFTNCLLLSYCPFFPRKYQ